MAIKNENNKRTTESKKTKVFLVDKHVCNFIKEEWMKEISSFREWAREHNVHEYVARKINQDNGYNIPVSTLKMICFYRKVTLTEFFKLVESKYGDAEDKFYFIEKKKDI